MLPSGRNADQRLNHPPAPKVRMNPNWMPINTLAQPSPLTVHKNGAIPVEGDEACREAGEGLVDVDATLVANGQAAKSVEPSMGALHDPAVAAELFAALDTLAGDARDDPACAALLPTRLGIVGLVGMQLVGASARSAAPARAQRCNGIEGRRHLLAIVTVGLGQSQAERRAAGVGDEVALRARLAPVRRVRAGGRPPFWPGQRHCPGSPNASAVADRCESVGVP